MGNEQSMAYFKCRECKKVFRARKDYNERIAEAIEKTIAITIEVAEVGTRSVRAINAGTMASKYGKDVAKALQKAG